MFGRRGNAYKDSIKVSREGINQRKKDEHNEAELTVKMTVELTGCIEEEKG